MAFEQQVGEGWRCDGCGKVARWDKHWRSYGSIAEQEEGIMRWVACSTACAKRMPKELRGGPPHRYGSNWDAVREYVERERERARTALPTALKVEV